MYNHTTIRPFKGDELMLRPFKGDELMCDEYYDGNPMGTRRVWSQAQWDKPILRTIGESCVLCSS